MGQQCLATGSGTLTEAVPGGTTCWPKSPWRRLPLPHSLASGQTTGREHSPTHQQKIGLKIFWGFISIQFSGSVVSDSLRPHELQHARPRCGIFLDQGSNSGLLHWQADFYHWATKEAQSLVFYYSSLSKHPASNLSASLGLPRRLSW